MPAFHRLCLFLLWVLLFNNCKPREEALPAPTTEGLNTFGCRINGKPWIANGFSNAQGSSAKPIEVEYRQLTPTTFYLFIHTHASTGDRVQLTLPKGVAGTNKLEFRLDNPFAIYYDSAFRLFTSYKPNSGKIVITKLDTANHIVSGTFDFEGEYIVNKEIIRVTDGRFDIDMDTL